MREPTESPQPKEDSPADGPARPAGFSALPGLPPLGALTLGALFVCVVSGIFLLTGYEPSRPLLSTLAFETGRPFGWFVRNVHAWSAHLSLLALLGHTVDYVVRRADRQTPAGTWITLLASLPLMGYLMLGGRAMPADAEGQGAASVLHGLLSQIPALGGFLANLLVGAAGGGDAHVLMTHHVVTATLLLAMVTVFHVRRLAPDPISAAAALGLSGAVALFARPELVGAPPDGKLRGPWFMGGLRLMLEVVPAWLAGLLIPFTMLACLGVLPLLSERGARNLRIGLAVATAAYVALTLAAVRA